MNPQRRQLLLAALAASLPGAAHAATRPANAQASRALCCWSDRADKPRKFFAGFSDQPHRAIALPARGHGLLTHPSQPDVAWVAARRPGQFLIRWQTSRGRELARFETEDDIRLEGHISFAPDGKHILATETDLITGEGRIGVYHAHTLRRVDSWSAHGIGPHALMLLPHGPHQGKLAVAIGGILTLPETGRVKRNLASMDPSLVLLDPASGKLHSQHRLPDPFMSIRHLALADDGTLGIALQNEGKQSPELSRPLLALFDDDTLRYADASPSDQEQMGRYAGDIASLNNHFALGCSHSGRIAIWRSTGQLHSLLNAPGACAMWTAHGQLQASADTGQRWRITSDAQSADDAGQVKVAWDNHALAA